MSEIRYHFAGQAGYEIDCRAHKKIRVVFAMIDEDKTSTEWYLSAAKAGARSKEACDATEPPVKFGFRTDIGRTIPHPFKKKIAIGDGGGDEIEERVFFSDSGGSTKAGCQKDRGAEIPKSRFRERICRTALAGSRYGTGKSSVSLTWLQ